ncbi:subtilisin family serine protease [Chryseobacterium sp. H1D6B]|uniref:S8 family peptidase n=1 Tax=Chryseobacterium sp. H1D6B TaxID=2940588 RepID=UPI0015C9D2F6|nr:S8 family peptidase [Chryseobacterium sp. H1D6B]MDH6252180.1 subtilisin family serine protease [Chryseobacterium sp. H1D6B]
MKLKFIIPLFCIFFNLFSAQSRKGQFQLSETSDSHTLYVCFSSEKALNETINRSLNSDPAFKKFIEENKIVFIYDLGFTDNKLREMASDSQKKGNTGESVKKLKRIYKIETPEKSNTSLIKLAEDLEKFPQIEYASLISNSPIEPPFKTALVTTPNLESSQTYLLSNPGIDANYAWSIGITGQNIKVRDVEYGFHKTHEMLTNRNTIQLESGAAINSQLTDPNSSYYNYLDHGTAVMSILGSAKDNIGLSGAAYNASEFKGFLEWTSSSYNRTAAVTRAINASQAGNIILYEMQTGGQNSNYVPAEYNNVVWDLTKAATDSGIIIIAAAGNGNENLDGTFYAAYNARGNSGAIIVGAGTDTTQHSKLSFSTYGSRVDVQGWGQNVLAAGYGSWAKYDNDNNRTYTQFNGTSSATPIVASAAILIQSYYFQSTGQYLSPAAMKNLLISTGIPQGGNLATKIGPLPNIKAAILSLQNNFLSAKGSIAHPLKVEVYPNPASNYISVRSQENKSIDFEIITMSGQAVLKGSTSPDKKLDISQLPKGVYFINSTDGQRRVLEKFIKQ